MATVVCAIGAVCVLPITRGDASHILMDAVEQSKFNPRNHSNLNEPLIGDTFVA